MIVIQIELCKGITNNYYFLQMVRKLDVSERHECPRREY
jgi:hypothetical protein